MPDLLTARQLPHSVEAEQAVLGSMIIDSRCVADVVGALRGEDFYSDVNRNIYEAIYTMFNYSMTIDPVTVIEQLRKSGTYTEGSGDYILKLMEITPTAANVTEYVNIVRDKSLLRRISDAGSEINALAMESQGTADSILELAEQRIYAIRQGRGITGLEPVSKVLVDVYTQLQEASKSGSRIPGLSTGLYDLDSAIMGLNKSDLILIAARPGMGKTSIALNIALNVAKDSGKTVAIFSLEMSREQLCFSLLSSESQVDRKKLQSGALTDEDWRRVSDASVAIGGMDIRLDDNPMLTVADINAAYRRVMDLGLVVIDYLQLMTSAGGTPKYGENRTTIVSDISRMLKIMAKELNVPVICASQLSRANEKREEKRPMLSDLRESGAIEQDADIVLALYRDDYYNKDTERPNIAECIILKNRRGETGTVELQWQPEFTSFRSLERRHGE